jgi:membrane protein implicated in regulation of membrane protease activity
METLNDWLRPEIVWFVIGFVFLLLEFVSPGVVIIFFGFGAWVVALTTLAFDISLNLQLMIFMVVSVLLLISLRRWFKELFHRDSEQASERSEIEGEFIGKRARVLQEIKPNVPGKIEFRGSSWIAEADEAIRKGATVEILSKTNITLTVKAL